MKRKINSFKCLLAAVFLVSACSNKFNEQEDEIYSRYLQTHVKRNIISTPGTDEKNELNLLLLNDGQDIELLTVKEAVTDLYIKEFDTTVGGNKY